MKNSTDKGYDQHYNVQVAVEQESLLIVANTLSNHVTDQEEAICVSDPPPPRSECREQSRREHAGPGHAGREQQRPGRRLPLTYRWTQTGGPVVTLSNPAVVNPTFTAPSDPTMLTFTLVVTDSLGLPDPTPDEVVVIVGGTISICRW